MTRTIVIVTVVLWMLLFMLMFSVFRQPGVALFPLLGLYPGDIASGSPGYSTAKMTAWAVGSGIVFLTLATIAIWLKSKASAIAFIVLFLASAVGIVMKISSALHDLH